MLAFEFAFILFTITYQVNSLCDTVYTVGDDEFCTVSLTNFEENCITFNETHNIAATNGLALDPVTGNIYIIASIGTKKGDRKLLHYNPTTRTLNTKATYTSNDKLAGLTATCSGELFGITGSQTDHSMYSVDTYDGSLSLIADLDVSTKGNGIAYDPMDDHIYRVGGNNTLDIEQIDFMGNITSDYYIDDIDIVRAIGYYKENYLFIIDGNEMLYELDTLSGNVTYLGDLSNGRKHKGIVCIDYHMFCIQTTTFIPDTTVIVSKCEDDAKECPDGTMLQRNKDDDCQFPDCSDDTDIGYTVYLFTNVFVGLFVLCL
eukprot:86844_1